MFTIFKFPIADPQNIYNGDELGLFWRLQANATYKIKDSFCKLGKQGKDRMTIFLAANMSGTDKLPILVIGKSENPRRKYMINQLNVNYYYNPSAWMNGEIFFDYIQKLNCEFIKQKSSILLFIDNCSAHPSNLSFSNVKIIFLPPNTTSVLQPMDAGIIKCFKGSYRVNLARKLISLVDSSSTQIRSNELGFSEAVCMAYAAWDELNPKTISNCFWHCGFYRAICLREEVIDNEYNEFNLLKSNFENIVQKDENIDFEHYVQIDQNLFTTEFNMIHYSGAIEINDTNDPKDANNLEEQGEDDIEITLKEAANYLDKLKSYSLQRQNKDFSKSLLQLVNQLENMIFTEPKDYKQTCLDFYLNR